MKRFLCLLLTAVILFCTISCGTEEIQTSQEFQKQEEIQKPYYFFVYNSDKISKSDYAAICELQALYSDYEIVMTDVIGLNSAEEVYRLLAAERNLLMDDPCGIQIFGDPSAVPAFVLRYEIEEYHSSGEFEIARYDDYVSDYFYTNFNNDSEKLTESSAYQLSQKLNEIDIIPEWPVVRLPLSRGQYSGFIEKYREYLSDLADEALLNISVASPIFPVGWYSVAADDTGYFLMRARDEWGIIDNLKMFGTTKGVYASSLELDGSCEAENWSYLTKEHLCEIFHDSHAGKTVLTQTIFDGTNKNEYHCEAVLEAKSINRVLSGKPYLLNTSGCEPAKDMTSNIITEALRGRCVGAIASTTLLSNVDVDCMLTAEEYDEGYTKFSLLYEYLLAKSRGSSRSKAFHAGQYQVATSLLQNAEFIHTHNLQANLNNLLGFHNFGMIDY